MKVNKKGIYNAINYGLNILEDNSLYLVLGAGDIIYFKNKFVFNQNNDIFLIPYSKTESPRKTFSKIANLYNGIPYCHNAIIFRKNKIRYSEKFQISADYLYFIDRSGKIAVFNYYSSQFLWELDMKNTIVNYLFSENGNLFILTLDKILILSENGNLISSYTHNKDMPISIFNIQEKIYLISKQGISYVNFVNESEDIVLKNKFTNNLNIYYEDQIIYLKDEKSLFKLSE